MNTETAKFRPSLSAREIALLIQFTESSKLGDPIDDLERVDLLRKLQVFGYKCGIGATESAYTAKPSGTVVAAIADAELAAARTIYRTSLASGHSVTASFAALTAAAQDLIVGEVSKTLPPADWSVEIQASLNRVLLGGK